MSKTSTGKVFNIGIIGLGDNGTMHLNGFERLENSRIAGICDKDAGARERTAALIEDKSIIVTDDYRKLCSSDEIDAVCRNASRNILKSPKNDFTTI